jgi:protein N-terminal amidase
MFSGDGFLWYDIRMPIMSIFPHCPGSASCIGYVFENATAITPYLEEPRLGPTSQFCSEIAKRLGCYVLAGYPERLSNEEDKPPLEALDITESNSGVAVGANSAVLYDPLGSWAGGYRKTNLYDTDKTWAKSGTCRDCLADTHLTPP